jgi:large exoprotein involved in heme utilization and adhesion
VRLSGTAPIATPDNISGILVSAESGATNDAGSLEIITQLLEITDGARISADNFGSGDNGGNINLNVEQIELNHGEIKATTQSGTGGIIAIHNLEQMTLTNDSTLTAQAFNNARGGNIYINAPTGAIIAAVDTNSDIIASAEQGEGGDIVINAQTLLGLAERRAIPSNETNDIDASSEFGTSGTITINSPDTDLRAASPEFSTAPPNTELAQGCQLQGSRVISEFFNTGRGGLPLNPYESFSSTNILDDLRLPTQATAATHSAAEPVEAQGWIVNSKGQVVLVANVNPIAPHACHLR